MEQEKFLIRLKSVKMPILMFPRVVSFPLGFVAASKVCLYVVSCFVYGVRVCDAVVCHMKQPSCVGEGVTLILFTVILGALGRMAVRT